MEQTTPLCRLRIKYYAHVYPCSIDSSIVCDQGLLSVTFSSFSYLSSMCYTSHLGPLVLQGLIGHSTILSHECLSHGFFFSFILFPIWVFGPWELWGCCSLVVITTASLPLGLHIGDHRGRWSFHGGGYECSCLASDKSCCIGLWVWLTPPVNLGIVMLWRKWSFQVVFFLPLCLLKVGTYTFLPRPGALLLKLLIIMWAAVTGLFSVKST